LAAGAAFAGAGAGAAFLSVAALAKLAAPMIAANSSVVEPNPIVLRRPDIFIELLISLFNLLVWRPVAEANAPIQRY
jgi:hypothetical protein